jgi:hypothetical protein
VYKQNESEDNNSEYEKSQNDCEHGRAASRFPDNEEKQTQRRTERGMKRIENGKETKQPEPGFQTVGLVSPFS